MAMDEKRSREAVTLSYALESAIWNAVDVATEIPLNDKQSAFMLAITRIVGTKQSAEFMRQLQVMFDIRKRGEDMKFEKSAGPLN